MTTTQVAKARVFGSGIRRREDPRLLTGTARYTADFTLPGMLHAAVLRSPHGHARIRGVDTSRARSAAGVVAVFTGADTEAGLKCIPCAWLLPNAGLNIAPYRAIAIDVVRYVGDAVAVVVAESDYQAYDALELIDVDYEPLPAVVDPNRAAADGAPQLHAEAPGNLAFHWALEGGDVAAAFQSADVVVRDRIVQQRLIPTAMETRGAVAQFIPATGELTLWNTTQNPHIVRFIMSLVTGVPEDRLRVVAPEVGGGFGSKIAADPGRFHRRVLLDEAGAAGEMDRDAVRELPVDDARTRSRAGRGAGRNEGRPHPWHPRHGLGGHGCVSVDRRARDSHHPARADAVGALQRPGGERRRLRRLHQHDAGGSVSGRRPARGDVHARAHARQARARAANGSGRDQAAQPDSAVRQRPRRRHRA